MKGLHIYVARSQPGDFDLPCLKVEAKCQAVVNGVPMAMGRALARAVLEVIDDSRRAGRARGGAEDGVTRGVRD